LTVLTGALLKTALVDQNLKLMETYPNKVELSESANPLFAKTSMMATFLRFLLKLQTGRIMELLSRQNFTKTRITSAMRIESAFSLGFDVDLSRTPGHRRRLQIVLRVLVNSARLRWPDTGGVCQILGKTNRLLCSLRPSEKAKEKLAQLFPYDDAVFKWFSYLCINHLDSDELSSDNEFQLARVVVRELYEHAWRHLPEYLPTEPIEKLYDSGRQDW